MSLTAIFNSNTQTTSHGGGLCFPKVLQIQIYILRFIATSICIQVTYKQQHSELHLHLDMSVFSIMCDDQDLQVPKLFHPGHPNLLCYNVWEERTLQLFSHHYMKALKMSLLYRNDHILEVRLGSLFALVFGWGFWGFVCGLGFFFFYINVHCIFQTVHCMHQSSKSG